MRYKQTKVLKDEKFRRLTGVKGQTFEKMVSCLVPNNYGYISVANIRDKKQLKKLWDNYYINAPEQRRKLVEKYSYLKKV